MSNKWSPELLFKVHGKALHKLLCETLELYARPGEDAARRRQELEDQFGEALSEFVRDLIEELRIA